MYAIVFIYELELCSITKREKEPIKIGLVLLKLPEGWRTSVISGEAELIEIMEQMD